MPLTRVYGDTIELLSGATGGALSSAAGSTFFVPCPVRGNVIEVGWTPNASVANTGSCTMTVTTWDNTLSSTSATSTQIVSSVLGYWSSTNLYAGAVASAIPPSFAFVPQGGALGFTFSGVTLAAPGPTFYAIIGKSS